jgi:hypothetical protein
MFGHFAVKDSAPTMRNDEEAIQHAKRQRRHGEKIHCRDCLALIVQEGCPSLRWLRASRRFPHPAQHRSLGDIETKHFQFSVNAWRAPSSVVCDHAKDEVAQFPADGFSPHASSMPRNPGPIHLESGSMPANHRLWLDENQRLLPSAPESPQDQPEQSISGNKPRLRVPPFQNGQLLPKREVFQEKVASRAKGLNSQNGQESQMAQHEAILAKGGAIVHLLDSTADRYFGEAQPARTVSRDHRYCMESTEPSA